MRVRFVAPSLPWPPDQGARIRAGGLIAALPDDVEVELWTVARPGEPAPPASLLERCVEWRRFARSRPNAIERWAWPRAARWFHSAELRDALARTTRDDADVVHLDEPSLVPVLPDAAPFAACVAHHKIESELAAARAGVEGFGAAWRSRLDAVRWDRVEADAAARVALHVVCSREDADRLRARFPHLDPVVVENGVDPSRFDARRRDAREPDHLLFLGSLDYAPNRDGLAAFLRTTWPALRAARPGVRLSVVGRGDAPDLRERCAFEPRVAWVGEVPDPRPWLARCSALVVPLRIGGGTRVKIVEALAAETPVVTTDAGAEGLALVDGVHAFRAELGDAFARATIAALDSAGGPVPRAGRALVAERYDWRALARRLADAWRARIA